MQTHFVCRMHAHRHLSPFAWSSPPVISAHRACAFLPQGADASALNIKLGLLSIFISVPCTLFWGWLADILQPRGIPRFCTAALSLAIKAVSFWIMLYVDFTTSPVLFWCCAVLAFYSDGSIAILISQLVLTLPEEIHGSLISLCFGLGALFTGFLSQIFGSWLTDLIASGSATPFTIVFYKIGIFPIVGVFGFLLMEYLREADTTVSAEICERGWACAHTLAHTLVASRVVGRVRSRSPHAPCIWNGCVGGGASLMIIPTTLRSASGLQKIHNRISAVVMHESSTLTGTKHEHLYGTSGAQP